MIAEFSHRLSRAVGACLIGALVLGGSTLAVGAQDDDEASSLDELREQREVIQEERAEQALKLDAATVSFDALVQALDDVNALVDLQEARLADANQQVRSAQAQAEAALVRQQEIAAGSSGVARRGWRSRGGVVYRRSILERRRLVGTSLQRTVDHRPAAKPDRTANGFA